MDKIETPHRLLVDLVRINDKALAAPALVRRVQELEEWQARALPWIEKVRDSLSPLKNGDYLDDSEGIQYELEQIKKQEALIAQGGK